jgi:hypothetical protein
LFMSEMSASPNPGMLISEDLDKTLIAYREDNRLIVRYPRTYMEAVEVVVFVPLVRLRRILFNKSEYIKIHRVRRSRIILYLVVVILILCLIIALSVHRPYHGG